MLFMLFIIILAHFGPFIVMSPLKRLSVHDTIILSYNVLFIKDYAF